LEVAAMALAGALVGAVQAFLEGEAEGAGQPGLHRATHGSHRQQCGCLATSSSLAPVRCWLWDVTW
jgi:hypothetical protein